MARTLYPHVVDAQEAIDTIALQQLVWTYCRAVDRRDLALLRSLYHDDAIDDHGAMFCGSPDDYIAWLPSMLERWEATLHLIANMVFVIDGDEAEGELVVIASHRTPPPDSRELVATGRYLDRYKRRDGVWRFFRRSLVLDWGDAAPISAASLRPPHPGTEVGRPDRTDPSYLRLLMFARVPD